LLSAFQKEENGKNGMYYFNMFQIIQAKPLAFWLRIFPFNLL